MYAFTAPLRDAQGTADVARTAQAEAAGFDGNTEGHRREKRCGLNSGVIAYVTDADEKLAYVSSWEHLSDELARLDIAIEVAVRHLRGGRTRDPLDQLRGLVVSDKEITELLSTRCGESESGPDAGEGGSELLTALRDTEAQIERRRAASLQIGVPLTLPHIAGLFRLDRFEQQCLVICLAPEVHRKYGKLYACLHDDATCRWPTLELMLELLCPSREGKLRGRRAFDVRSPLRRFRLLHVVDRTSEGALPFSARPLRLDDRIADWLLGAGHIQTPDESLCELRYPADALRRSQAPLELERKIRGFVRSHFADAERPRRSVVFHLRGAHGPDSEALAEAAASELGLPLLVADAGNLGGGTAGLADTLWSLAREAYLQPAVLCVQNFDGLAASEPEGRIVLKKLLAGVELFSRLTFLLGSRAWHARDGLRDSMFIALELEIPDDAVRAGLWRTELASHSLAGKIDFGSLASTFHFTSGQIRDTVVAARDRARWRSSADDEMTERDIYEACRGRANLELSKLARKVVAQRTWDDIVLPTDPLDQLHEISNQARKRSVVLGEWGFHRKLPLGKGLSVLFSGPPGTGKTMAAEVVASELGLDLYKIDLSQVVSKYIGETEKNLDRIFAAAGDGNAILFFDEADALFGKRSEVRDSHDRYANLEISYLLQKMEEYEGISILATNLRQHLDEAFLRRLQEIVEFPFPDAEYRERIWRVTFPSDAPLGEDVDFGLLAHEIPLAGGNIKNIGLSAAYLAANDGGRIQMSHLLRAARREHRKLGRSWNGLRRPVAQEAAG